MDVVSLKENFECQLRIRMKSVSTALFRSQMKRKLKNDCFVESASVWLSDEYLSTSF